MMHLVLARCFAVPEVMAIIMDPLASNTHAHRFYERLGFRFDVRRRFGEDDCLVYRLAWADYRPALHEITFGDKKILPQHSG